MGIQGFMSYVGEHREFFVDLQLKNTDVVIDGNNLYHRLYFDSNLDVRHGGDYDSFTDVVHQFFEALTMCNIRPYVVLDGGCDASDKKLTTLKERAREKIQAAHSLSCGGGGSVLPLLIREVFKQILAKLQVPFVQSFSEADRDIVSLANHLNCPVLTLDSDFCIFDLKAGYCPLNYFQWRNLCRGKNLQDCYIPARCFSLERFCNHFNNMNKTLLPLFAVMNGNDYINLPAIEMFFSKVHLPVGSSRQKGRKHIRIQGLLNWLSRFADPAEAIENILKYLKKHEEEETRQLLAAFMEEYQPSDVNLKDFFQNGVYESEEAKKLELPDWILTALAKGLLAPFISDALVLKRTILHVQVENMQRPSAHAIALPVRQVIYGLLCSPSEGPISSSLSKESSSSTPIFREFDRIQKALKKSFVQAAVLPGRFGGDRYSLTTLNQVPLTDRLLFLLETLGVTASSLEAIPCLLQLPVAITCYWIQHAEPRVKLQHMKALLLGIVFGELDKTIHSSDPEVPHTEVNKIVYDQFLKWKEKKSQKEPLELDAAHIFCQWQCCLQMGLYLNQLLCSPVSEPDLTRFDTERFYSSSKLWVLQMFWTSVSRFLTIGKAGWDIWESKCNPPGWTKCENYWMRGQENACFFTPFILGTRLYNGTLVHKLYHELKLASTPEDLLSASPRMYQLYCDMVHTVKDVTPAGFFQKKKSKDHRRKNKHPNHQVLAENLPSCSSNNRFATLMVEN